MVWEGLLIFYPSSPFWPGPDTPKVMGMGEKENEES